MKQKRKVKSLLPYKIDKDGTMLTILLLILSLVLCLGSASLMTVSVGAADDRGNFKMVYPGLDDRVEVLYGLQFSDPNPDKLWNEFVNEFYVDNESLYLTPNQVKVKAKSSTFAQNTVDTGKYINVLGGEDNRIYSDNITLIAGYGNEVAEDNDNVSILGGQGNKILGSSSGAPAVIAGGDTNVIENNNSNVIVGGDDNKIVNAENATILGGESNTVNGGENIIIGGKNVEVNGASNIFAFSNFGSFEPATSDAFYLNLSGGVGVNVDAAVRGLSVKGAVGFGEIDISEECKNENIGVEGYWNVDGYGCLVGCTEKSKNGGNWELLDRGSICEEKCSNNSRCIYEPTDITGNIVSDYTAFCTDHVSTANAERCTTGENESFENVVFETILIASSEECPVSGHNKCVYRCNPGTDLTGSVGVVASCSKRCELPWDHSQTIPHGAIVTGYNVKETVCASRTDNNPIPPHTCKNHKKMLICSGGILYVTNNGKTPTNTTAESGGYIHESCTLGGYRCETDANNYNLTISVIEGRLKDRPNNAKNSRIVADRTPVNGFRGQYKLCIDYDATPPADGMNGENCSTGDITPTPYHYKLIKCQSGYSTGAGYEDVCMQKCTLTDLDGHVREYVHLTVITGYQASGAVCTGTCMSAKIVCDDGKWRLGSETGPETMLYPYNDCILSDKKCSGFPVSQATVTEHGQYSYYGSCDPYKAQGKSQCNREETEYILTGCHDNYHTESGHESRNQWCISNEKIVDCLVGDKDSTKYEYIVTGVKVTWSGGWNRGSWNKAKTCEWKCRDGHHLSGDYNNGGVCVSNKKTVPCKTGWAEEHVNYDVKNVEISWIGSRNTGYWDEPADCSESGCVAGRCGDACGSETKTTKCSSDPAMPAEYAHEINTGVELTVSCDENPYCRWSCDTGHHLENGKCEPNARQCEEVGELMEGAYYDHTQNFTYWEGEWDTGHWVTEPCNILCTGGYYPEPVSGVCVKLPGCQGNLSGSQFNFAVVVASGADDMTGSVDRAIYEDTEAAEGHLCALVCDDEHVLVDGTCKKCFKESDTFDQETLTCVNDIVCPEDYASLCEKNTNGLYECNCEFLGKCVGSNGKEYSKPGSGAIIINNSYTVSRPYWKNLTVSQQNQDGLQRTCYNNPSILEGQEHKCKYACGAGYKCPTDYKKTQLQCVQEVLSCASRNFYGYVTYNTTPINGKTSWDMYYEESVDYGSFDSGLVLKGSCTNRYANCYDLDGQGCAWACQAGSKLSQWVTEYSYQHRNDSNFLEWHCWKKCSEDEYYTDDGCKKCVYNNDQYVPNTGFLLGPDEDGYGTWGTGNAVRCVRRCPKFYNYDAESNSCQKVVCDEDNEYITPNTDYLGKYSCNTCEIDDGYFLDGRDDEAGAYTECEYKCEKGVSYWDNEQNRCRYLSCEDYGSNYYFDLNHYNGSEYFKHCFSCGTQRLTDTNTWSNTYENYLGCRNRCPDGQLYFNGQCIPSSVDIQCGEGEMLSVDGNGNAKCVTCLEGGKTWDPDQRKCV